VGNLACLSATYRTYGYHGPLAAHLDSLGINWAAQPGYWVAYTGAHGETQSWTPIAPASNDYLGIASAYVDPLSGTCPGGTIAVTLTTSDWEALKVSANVVTELQTGWNYGVIGLVVVCLFVGFIFGYKVFQRGGSQ